MPTDPIYLQDISCFRDLSEDQRKAVAELATSVCFPSGYILFEEGRPGSTLYILVNGKVEVLYNISEQGPVRVDIASGEEVVGCSAFVPPYSYTATVRCLTEVEVIELDAEALRQLMRDDCYLGLSIQQNIMMVLLERILDFRLGIKQVTPLL
jgi:CRP-like cAMP-binding protein